MLLFGVFLPQRAKLDPKVSWGYLQEEVITSELDENLIAIYKSHTTCKRYFPNIISFNPPNNALR